MPRFSTSPRTLTAGLLIASSGLMAACDQSSSGAAVKVSDAGRSLGSVSSGDDAESRTQRFNAITNELRDLNSVPSAKDAASVITAQATAGIAQVSLENAHVQSAEVLKKLSGLRADIEQYVRVHSFEQGVASQSFDEHFDRLDTEAKELSDRLNAERSRLSGIEETIKNLNTERADRTSAARSLREEIVELMATVKAASAMRRQPVIEEANAIGRRADAFEAQAAELQIQIEDAQLRQRSVQMEIDLFGRQRDLNAKARETTETAQSKLRQQREELAQKSKQIADEIRTAYTAVIGEYEQGALKSFEEAVSGFDRAAQQASSGSGVPGAGNSATTIRLMKATALTARGTLEMALADTGSSIASVVPGTSEFLRRIEAFEVSGKDAILRAADVYDGASSVLDNASEEAAAIRASVGVMPAENTMDNGLDDGAADDGFDDQDDMIDEASDVDAG